MTITTLDGVIAGLHQPNYFSKAVATSTAGRMRSLFYAAGNPGPAVASVAGVNGESLTAYAGQLPFINAGAGSEYLARFAAWCSSQVGSLLLCDRLWHNSGLSVTSTSLQSITSPAFPARDRDGSTNGADIQIGLEVSTVMGAGTPTITLGYTNSAGTAGRSAVSSAVGTTMAVGDFVPLPLQAGDVGVRAVESLTLSATMTSGAYSLVAYRVLATLGLGQIGQENAVDFLSAGGPKMYDNTVPFLIFVPGSTTAGTVGGQLSTTEG
jgi:hypothetical protein